MGGVLIRDRGRRGGERGVVAEEGKISRPVSCLRPLITPRRTMFP